MISLDETTLLDAPETVTLEPGDYIADGVRIAGTKRLIAPGATFRGAGNGRPLFVLDGWADGCLEIASAASMPGDGPIFDVVGTVANVLFTMERAISLARGGPILRIDRTESPQSGMFFCEFRANRWTVSRSATFPGVQVSSKEHNNFSSNQFRVRRYDCGAAPFFDISCEAPRTSFAGNGIYQCGTELADNGFVRLRGVDGFCIHDVTHFDNGSIKADLIAISHSQAVDLRNVRRRKGVLAAGVVDIRAVQCSDVRVEGCGGTTKGVGYTVDVGGRPVPTSAPKMTAPDPTSRHLAPSKSG